MRVGGYLRLSRDEDKESYSSIISQRSIIEECAQKNNWVVCKYYEDDNYSGYSFDRPAFNQLIQDLEQNKIDVVIAKDLSRIGRHNAYTLLFIEQIKNMNKRLVLPKEGAGYDTCQDESDLLGITTWYNEMYIKDISRKIRSSISSKQKEGKLIIKEHFGYVKSTIDKHMLEIDAEAAEIVRLIFTLYNSGIGYRKVADVLNERGCPTPSQYYRYRQQQKNVPHKGKVSAQWNAVHVQRILKNDIYIGRLRLSKTEKKMIKGKSIRKSEDSQYIFENHHDAIVDRSVFEETQNIMNNRKKTGSKGVASQNNIFSGLLVCKDCGSYMIAYHKKGRTKSYICGRYHRQGKAGCHRHTVSEKALEDYVKHYLGLVIELMEAGALEINIEWKRKKVLDSGELLYKFQKEHGELKDRFKLMLTQKLYDMKKENRLPYQNIIQDGYAQLESELKDRLLYLEGRIKELEEDLQKKKNNNHVGFDTLELLKAVVNKAALEKMDVELLIEKVQIDHRGHPHIFLKGDSEPICNHIREDVNWVPDQ